MAVWFPDHSWLSLAVVSLHLLVWISPLLLVQSQLWCIPWLSKPFATSPKALPENYLRAKSSIYRRKLGNNDSFGET